jgi:hypothetical protein
MNVNELMADVLGRDVGTMKATLGDFSDQDMLARPAPAANHAAWQLGHLVVAETNCINAVKPGSMPELPAGFAERFTKDTAKKDSPADFPSKEELLRLFEKTRAATAAWVKTLSPQDYATPTPEKLRGWVPTVGHLVVAMTAHPAMHIGQFQVIRRKLGKPVLF